MLGTLVPRIALVKLLQSVNTDPLKLMTLLGMLTAVKPELAKAPSSMSTTLSGIVTPANWLQLLNAACPILATLFPIITLVKPLQSAKEDTSRRVTGRTAIVSGMIAAPLVPIYLSMVTVPLVIE